ncbi:phage terminase large subunit family protein [Holospora elegans]|nr:phage terminase large subunit family protein [Holospora elegans]
MDDKGKAPDWQRLFERKKHNQLGAPCSGLVLTAGADVKKPY